MQERFRREIARTSDLLVCLDFDGTLAPIVDDPADAKPTDANATVVENLRRERGVEVSVVSGRALDDVATRVPGGLILAGNHGLEIELDGDRWVHPDAKRLAPRVAECATAIEMVTGPFPGVRVQQKGLCATIHYRSTPSALHRRVQAIVASTSDRLGGEAVNCSAGKRIVELRPAVDWGKGDAVTRIADGVGGDPFVVYVGDDVTDESAFESVRSFDESPTSKRNRSDSNDDGDGSPVKTVGIGVRVGGGQETAASCYVQSPHEVASFLSWLGELCRRGDYFDHHR